MATKNVTAYGEAFQRVLPVVEAAEQNRMNTVAVPTADVRVLLRAIFELGNEVSAQSDEVKDWRKDATAALAEKHRLQTGVEKLYKIDHGATADQLGALLGGEEV